MDILRLVSLVVNPPLEIRLIYICRAILGTFVFGILALLLPTDSPVDRKGTIDWVGAFLGTGGLIAFNIAWK